MKVNKVAIGCDHAGFSYKKQVLEVLDELGIEVVNKGTNSFDSVDYPDFIHPVAEAVEKGEVELGVIMCGSGNGVAMTANKHQSIRAALCWNAEIAALARSHNDANIVSLPVRFISEHEAKEIIKAFFTTSFEGGRHQRRVDKIMLKGKEI